MMGAQPSMMEYLDGKQVTEAEYKAEMDLRTMIESEKIKMDPKRLKACMARKKKLYKALTSIMGSSHMDKKKMSGNSSHEY